MSKYLFLAIALFFLNVPFANAIADQSAIAFFVSNNTHEMNMQTAFHSMQGKEQKALRARVIKVMQTEQMTPERFEDVLGTYKTSADNSLKILIRADKKIRAAKIFKIATHLAKTLKQESVAVFIPVKGCGVGDTFLKLKSHPYTISETIYVIRSKLPVQYAQAFSLHLNKSTDFANATVDEIEWLGSHIKAEEIRKGFPQEEVSFYYGKAFLINDDHFYNLDEEVYDAAKKTRKQI